MSEDLSTLRLDKWLWATRFFKTRGLATQAISGGKVHVNQQRVKASKEIKIGDHIYLTKDRYHWEITVVALNKQRRPASEAVLLYQESPESQQKRAQQIEEEHRYKELFPNDNAHRPNKKERRLIHRFKQS